MGDFYLDFRDIQTRRSAVAEAAAALKFCEDSRVTIFERPEFSLVVTSVDQPELWGAYEVTNSSHSVLVAAIGRIAMDEAQWKSAAAVPGNGGLAGKAIFQLYTSGGIDALKSLNGHFVAVIHDAARKAVHLVTDRFGMCLAYRGTRSSAPLVFASHPDVLASAIGERENWDRTSLSEFLLTGRLSFPHTYYQNVKAVEPASILTFRLSDAGAIDETPRTYFVPQFNIDSSVSEDALADDLARAFQNAIRRRTLPIFGTIGLGLSGGLDSRVILSSIEHRGNVRAFSLFDEENSEFNVAKSIAKALGVELIPIRRDSEHYGAFAEDGVRISGGMGCIRSNHYLGVRRQLRELGIQNLLTGCYCDYIFKALALNTRESSLLRVQQLNGFDFEFYLSCYWPETKARSEVQSRLHALFPEAGRAPLREADWLEVERKRSFPLAYEGDLAMRVIPQRVIPWYVPIADNDLLEVYLRIPSRLKLNSTVFRKMLARICPESVASIPDNNTGARPDAGTLVRAVHRYRAALVNRIEQRVLRRRANRGSWPTWENYFRQSKVVAEQWQRPNPLAQQIFTETLGYDPTVRAPETFSGKSLPLFSRLWTQKLWLDQRCSAV